MVPLSLHTRHASLGASFDELRGREVVRRYSLASEDAALRAGAGLVDLSAREVVRVSGPDRVSFLHGMVTQEVNRLPEGGVADAALLTAKGTMVSDARVVRRVDDLLLLVEPGFAAPVLEALNRFLISEDAALADASSGFGQLALVGPRAEGLAQEALRLQGPPDGTLRPFEVEGAEGWAMPEGLLLPGLDLLVPAEALPPVVERLLTAGAVPAGFEALEVLRVERGTPRFGADMDEKTIPLEARLERALSYQKGCYIGQEVIARATFRGHMNRHLVGLSFDAPPPLRSELFRGERKVGWVTSAVESPRFGAIGLGYVHRDVEQPGTALTLPGEAGRVTVRALPFSVEDG
jgi:folate-binding protein YgfZ